MPTPSPEQPIDEIRKTMALAHIGAFVVAMGNLESAICRLVEWLWGNPNPGQIATAQALSWKELLKRMDQEAQQRGIGDQVRELTERHKLSQLVSLRHSLVHSAVLVTPNLLLINRRPARGDNHMILVRTDTVHKETDSANALIGDLDALLPEIYRRVTANLAAGVVGLTREKARTQGVDPDVPIDEQLPPPPDHLVEPESD